MQLIQLTKQNEIADYLHDMLLLFNINKFAVCNNIIII